MLVGPENSLAVLRCPRTLALLKQTAPDRLTCAEGHSCPVVNGKPVLIDFSDSVLSEDEITRSAAGSRIARRDHGVRRRVKRMPSPPRRETRQNVRRLVADPEALGRPARRLVVGAGSIGQGMEPLYDHPGIAVLGFDIYDSPHVQFIADGHHLPLPDGLFDAVVVQAVLEDVLQPAQVVAEIRRVLRPGGLVYAETPFMQQVHEGPYDFTRFTESGHRYQFRDFSHVASGACGGPGIQFMWSVDHLARGLFRSTTAGKLAKLAFLWTQYLDRLIPEDYAWGGASGGVFYGCKAGQPMAPREIIPYYRGAQGPKARPRVGSPRPPRSLEARPGGAVPPAGCAFAASRKAPACDLTNLDA